jgi:hypothetical protein
MLDPKLIRESPELVRAAIAKKHLKVDLDAVLAADAAWRAHLQEVEQLRSVQKAANASMAALPKGSPEFAAKLAEMKAVSAQVKEKDRAEGGRGDVPRGHAYAPQPAPRERSRRARTPAENVVFSTHGDPAGASPNAVAHWDIPGFSRLFDFERGAKVTGAGFPFFIGDGARLVRSLINFFLEEDARAGYVEVSPPDLRQRGERHGDRPAPRQGGPDVRDDARPALRRPDRGGAPHEFLQGRDPGRGRASDQALRLHALLPAGGRQLRQGRARPQPPAPVRQGRAAEVGAPVASYEELDG